MPSHHQNSRRRFLAFLGLVGAPAAVWAIAHYTRLFNRLNRLAA